VAAQAGQFPAGHAAGVGAAGGLRRHLRR
jgi:hypothetical protein